LKNRFDYQFPSHDLDGVIIVRIEDDPLIRLLPKSNMGLETDNQTDFSNREIECYYEEDFYLLGYDK
jgi:hypothetical protein